MTNPILQNIFRDYFHFAETLSALETAELPEEKTVELLNEIHLFVQSALQTIRSENLSDADLEGQQDSEANHLSKLEQTLERWSAITFKADHSSIDLGYQKLLMKSLHRHFVSRMAAHTELKNEDELSIDRAAVEQILFTVRHQLEAQEHRGLSEFPIAYSVYLTLQTIAAGQFHVAVREMLSCNAANLRFE